MTEDIGSTAGTWIDIGPVDAFPADTMTLVHPGGRRVVLMRGGAAWTAFDDACPHAGEPLHLGISVPGAIVCRAHGWKFALEDGRCLGGAPAARLPIHRVRIVGCRVEVEIARPTS